MSIFDGKVDSENARYVITGNECNLNSRLEIKKTDCIAVYYEIQDLKPFLGSESSLPDSVEIAQFWGLAFSSVLFLWLFSHGIGHILKLVKNA
jgi:hypothetical protein